MELWKPGAPPAELSGSPLGYPAQDFRPFRQPLAAFGQVFGITVRPGPAFTGRPPWIPATFTAVVLFTLTIH